MPQVTFKGHLAIEGKSGKVSRSLRLSIPTLLSEQLRKAGQVFPGWVRVSVAGNGALLLYARRPPSRATVDFVLPHWRFPDFKRGDELEVTVEPSEPWRAKPGGTGFDWLPFVDTEEYFSTEEDGMLLLWNRYSEPFAIRRYPTGDLHWWLLGFYQAEGSKSEIGHDFSAANKLPLLLNEMVTALTHSWGIERKRLHMEVLHKAGEPPEPAVALYFSLGVRITAVRPRVDKRNNKIGEHAGVLHVANSRPLRRLVNTALEHIFANDFPSREAAKAYALGWLDGDGSITINSTLSRSIELRLAGYKTEQEVVLRALFTAYEWDIREGTFGVPTEQTVRALSLNQAAELVADGAFQFSISRARLIHMLGQRLRDYKNQGRSLTSPSDALAAEKIFYEYLADEAKQLLEHPSASIDFRTGEKCVPYPLKNIRKRPPG